MLLLPDIEFMTDGRRHTLSIQDPYLLNGYIITDIDVVDFELSYSMRTNCRVRIRNEHNFYIEVSSEEIEWIFRREMDLFISRYGYDACVEGRHDIRNWSDYDFSKYMNEIKEQCYKIRHVRNGCYYLDMLKRDLRRQRRSYRENGHIVGYYEPASIDPTPILQQSFYREFLCDWGERTPINNNSAVRIKTERKYIHPYNYKPEFIHHYLPGEDVDTELLLGCEIEVDCGGKSEAHAKNVLEIVNSNNLEDKMYCMSDGSLTDGLEFASMPCSLEYHRKEIKYKEMFKYLDEHGYKAHDTTTCGLHIHADRKYLGKTELTQQLTISKILYIIEKFNDEICIIARRSNKYSQFVGEGKNEKSVVELYNKYKNKDKYVALNLKHDVSIEFRCFKSTLKYETFILTLEFVKDIIDYAKSINIEQIELMKWSDLMETFSDELKAYYNERLEKENKKKETTKEETTATATASISWNLNDINQNRTIISPNAIRGFNSNTIYIIDDHILDSEGYIPFSLRLNEPAHIERTELEILKDKEKSIKKKIKYSNIPMEKKNLEKELKEIQKELKKEKKRVKLNNNTER